jgi:hypothetical protein
MESPREPVSEDLDFRERDALCMRGVVASVSGIL